LDIGYFDGIAVVIDRPAVTRYAVDTVGICHAVIDIHRYHGIIGIDINMIDIIRGLIELIAVDGSDKAFPFGALFLEIDLALGASVLGIDNEGVPFLAIRTTSEGYTELIGTFDGKGEVVLITQTAVEGA
jgi:Na+-transporting NADH:ubiquinone oxidoreductase subunit NqrA